jgi:hypothetical protein
LLVVHEQQPLHRFGHLNKFIREKIQSFVQHGGDFIVREYGKSLCGGMTMVAFGEVSIASVCWLRPC